MSVVGNLQKFFSATEPKLPAIGYQSNGSEELGIVKICRSCKLIFNNLTSKNFSVEWGIDSVTKRFYIQSKDRIKHFTENGVYRISFKDELQITKLDSHSCDEINPSEGCKIADFCFCDKCAERLEEKSKVNPFGIEMSVQVVSLSDGKRFIKVLFPTLNSSYYLGPGRSVVFTQNGSPKVYKYPVSICSHT